jgi:hypothetical protein
MVSFMACVPGALATTDLNRINWWLCGRQNQRQNMALTISDMQKMSMVVEDLKVFDDHVTFVLVNGSMNPLRDDTIQMASHLVCKAPRVAGYVVVSKMEIQSDGKQIPSSLMPDAIEQTLSELMEVLRWHETLIVSPKEDSRSIEDLISFAAQKFNKQHPGATGFDFGSLAAKIFQKYANA